MPKTAVLADAGWLVALLDAAEYHHQWAARMAQEYPPPWLTCEAVIAESAHILGEAETLMAFIETGDLVVDFDLSREAKALRVLLRRYSDRRMDLADACIVRMTELHPRCIVLTTDRGDFTVYRRNRRDLIPCQFPPQR